IENFLLDFVFHQTVEFLGSRRPAPLRFEVHVQLAQVVQGQRNLLGRLDSDGATVQGAVDDEQRNSEQQEVQQWLAQSALQNGLNSYARPAFVDQGLRLTTHGLRGTDNPSSLQPINFTVHRALPPPAREPPSPNRPDLPVASA